MPDHSKRPDDPFQLAKLIVGIAAGDVEDRPPTPEGHDMIKNMHIRRRVLPFEGHIRAAYYVAGRNVISEIVSQQRLCRP
jgi:hypothetical protein